MLNMLHWQQEWPVTFFIRLGLLFENIWSLLLFIFVYIFEIYMHSIIQLTTVNSYHKCKSKSKNRQLNLIFFYTKHALVTGKCITYPWFCWLFCYQIWDSNFFLLTLSNYLNLAANCFDLFFVNTELIFNSNLVLINIVNVYQAFINICLSTYFLTYFD